MVVWPIPEKVVRIDAGFLDPRYPSWRKTVGLPPAEHPGVDINIQGTSGNGDLGYPVRAIAEGRVVHAQQHRVWGWVVLIEHPTLARVLGMEHLATQYAHLQWVSVEEGEWVLPGWAIGSIGRGDPMAPFVAHLHFEVRRRRLPADYWPGADRQAIVEGYLDPLAFLKAHGDLEVRFVRPALVLHDRDGRYSIPVDVTVNVTKPTLAQVRISGRWKEWIGR